MFSGHLELLIQRIPFAGWPLTGSIAGEGIKPFGVFGTCRKHLAKRHAHLILEQHFWRSCYPHSKHGGIVLSQVIRYPWEHHSSKQPPLWQTFLGALGDLL
jgi:hypothetical protein